MTDRIAVFAMLGGSGEHDYPRMHRALRESLDAGRFSLIDDSMEAGNHQVVLAATDHHITVQQAELLRDFVRRGGGVVLLHSTLAAWSSLESIRELAGWIPSGPGPVTELVIRPDPDHPITQALSEWKVRDELYLSEGPPLDANVLLRASWRFTEQVVAYERRFGEGRFIYLGLGHEPSTYADSTFQQLVGRMLLYAAGHQAPPPPVGVGLVGYGAIARDHAAAITATSGLRLAGVCDLSAERRELAAREWSVPVHARIGGLLDDADVGLVVVGTPPSAHVDPVLAALGAGKHVVCEKPFALRVDEVDRMIDAAAAQRVVLTVYQSRRWDPDYLALREVVRSGRIGEPFYMESFIGGYSHPCDLWHSHEPISGGTIYDWGSHYFDWILQLFGGVVHTVTAAAHKRVWLDVTNADQVRVDLTFEGGAQATFLQTDIGAARKPKWYVLGTEGAVVGEWAEAEVPADFPARVKVLRPANGGTSEELLALPVRDEHAFYRNLADHLAWGERLAVTPEEARRTVAVMEAATQSIARGGAQLRVQI